MQYADLLVHMRSQCSEVACHHTVCSSAQLPAADSYALQLVKHVIVQVVEKSGDKGLTAAEITDQVLARRPRGTYPHSVRGERSRVRSIVCRVCSNLYHCIGLYQQQS